MSNVGIIASQDAGPPPPIGCAYPLNATLEQLEAGGFQGRLDLSDDDQTGTYTIVGGLGSARNYAAANGTGQQFDFTSGKKVIEFHAAIPVALETDPASIVGITGGLVTGDYSHSILILTGNRTLSGVSTYVMIVSVDGVNKYAAYDLVDPVETIGVVMDAGTNTLTVYANGTPVTLSSSTITPAHYGVFMECMEIVGMVEGDVGKTYAMTLRSFSGDMTGSYGGGTTDPCGNPFIH